MTRKSAGCSLGNLADTVASIADPLWQRVVARVLD